MLISRIQAADASIPSDLGRDVSTVQALQRKHQVFPAKNISRVTFSRQNIAVTYHFPPKLLRDTNFPLRVCHTTYKRYEVK